MSKRVGNVAIIEDEEPTTCEQCGKNAETRPYGPNGIRVCFACAMLDEEGTKRRMNQVLFGDKPD